MVPTVAQDTLQSISRVETRIKDLSLSLLSEYKFKWTDSVIDKDGFPHPSAHEIRIIQNQIHRLRYDQKELYATMEKFIFENK